MIIIYNPTAGARRASALWRVLDILSTSGIRVQLAETSHAGHATSLAREAALAGSQMVVAAGGDGTIAEVASGLEGSATALGVIPMGTANVLALEMGLPFAPAAIAASLAFGRTRQLWPGMARGPNFERLFVQMLGVGLDAQVVHQMPRALKRSLGRAAYLVQTLAEMTRYGFAPIRLKLDGVEMQAGSAIISKGRFYAGHYLLAPAAEPSARGFSVALFGHTGPGAVLMYGAALTLNLLPRAPGLRLLRAGHVEILGSAYLPAQADGDPAGQAPLVITDAPAAIRVVVAR